MSRHDKSKTGGGLLDSLFGRPKTKSKSNYATNGNGSGGAAGGGGGGGGGTGGRPTSQDHEQLADMHDITNQIMRLDQEQVNQKFMEILEDMNIPKDKRQPLLLKSLEDKREMLIMKGISNYNVIAKVLVLLMINATRLTCCKHTFLIAVWTKHDNYEWILSNCEL